MRLQKRDRDIINYLTLVKCLDLNQVQVKFFPGRSLDSVRKRLRKLHSASVVVLRKEIGLDTVVVIPGTRPIAHISHLNAINWVRLAAEKQGVDWIYAAWELPGMGWNYPVIPDTCFSIGGKIYLCEVDNQTESKKQLTDKFRNYAAFDFTYTFVGVGFNSRSIGNVNLCGDCEQIHVSLDEIKAALR